ncbi:MAG: oxygen-independent coproporphyrinogen III oxidase [Alphaproteobacteria bacterium]|nr:oxygen-independent coproporphyrinogen III oxidase [Alphaproteobacteria bacterium]
MNDKQHSSILAKYPKQLPRYTSYPAAPHFYAMEAPTYVDCLTSLDKDAAISLYVHIPYCRKLCWFCGCSTKITRQQEPIQHYLDVMLKEAHLVRETIGFTPKVAHIHFGGGSPSIISADDFRTSMKTLRELFELTEKTEIAIEIDPRNCTEGKIAAYKQAGVNRISLGVQDFDINVQMAINRYQPFLMVYDTIHHARNYGISQINLDLIYGLPKQTLQTFKQTVDYAIILKPDRISLFGYAHVPWVKKHMQLINEDELPNDELRFELFKAASAQLKLAGYTAIGLDHFVKSNDSMETALHQQTLSRNFQGYSTDSCETLIPLGASSIGHFKQGYIQNTPDIAHYEQQISQGHFATARGFILSNEDRIRRAIIEQLMCYFEVDLNQICTHFNISQSHFNPLLESLKPMEEDGLITWDASCIRVNPAIPQAARIVSSLFDAYLTPGIGYAKVA